MVRVAVEEVKVFITIIMIIIIIIIIIIIAFIIINNIIINIFVVIHLFKVEKFTIVLKTRQAFKTVNSCVKANCSQLSIEKLFLKQCKTNN